MSGKELYRRVRLARFAISLILTIADALICPIALYNTFGNRLMFALVLLLMIPWAWTLGNNFFGGATSSLSNCGIHGFLLSNGVYTNIDVPGPRVNFCVSDQPQRRHPGLFRQRQWDARVPAEQRYL